MKYWLGLVPVLLAIACSPVPTSPPTTTASASPSAAPITAAPTPTPTRSLAPNLGRVSSLPGRFDQVQDIAVDAAGNLYTAGGGGSVVKIDAQGLVTVLVPYAPQSITFGVAVGLDGNVYASDSVKNVIYRITPDGQVSRLPGAAPFTLKGLAADRAGHVYVVEEKLNRISKISPDGHVAPFAGYGGPDFHNRKGGAPDDAAGFKDGLGTEARFNQPKDVAIDAAGNLYVADTGNLAIRRITPEGQVSTLYGKGRPSLPPSPPPGTPSIDPSPYYAGTIPVNALTVDAAGNVYALGGNRLRRLTPAGEVQDLAGSDVWCINVSNEYISPDPYEKCFADGQGAQARFSFPGGLTVDARGRLYVADTYNGRIRLVE